VCRRLACRAVSALALFLQRWWCSAGRGKLRQLRLSTYSVRVVGGPNTGTLEEESHARNVLALAIAEGVHELAELSCALNLEEDLVVVVGDLDVQVLRGTGVLWLLGGRTVVRHGVCAWSRCAVVEVRVRSGWRIRCGARLFRVSVGVRRR
jgi:hypothetical protein